VISVLLKTSFFHVKRALQGRRKLNKPVGFEEGNMGYDYDLGEDLVRFGGKVQGHFGGFMDSFSCSKA
jgi:hypothetical protein